MTDQPIYQHQSQAGHYVVAAAIILATVLLILFLPRNQCCCCCQRPAAVASTTTFGQLPVSILPGSKAPFRPVARLAAPVAIPTQAVSVAAPYAALADVPGYVGTVPEPIAEPQLVQVAYADTFGSYPTVHVGEPDSSLAWFGALPIIGGLAWLRRRVG